MCQPRHFVFCYFHEEFIEQLASVGVIGEMEGFVKCQLILLSRAPAFCGLWPNYVVPSEKYFSDKYEVELTILITT